MPSGLFHLNTLVMFISYIGGMSGLVLLLPCFVGMSELDANSVDLIRRRDLRRLIWVYTVCPSMSLLWDTRLKWVKSPVLHRHKQYNQYFITAQNICLHVYTIYSELFISILQDVYELTLALLNPDMPCLCKQWRSRSVTFLIQEPTDLDLHCLSFNMWIYIKICIKKTGICWRLEVGVASLVNEHDKG